MGGVPLPPSADVIISALKSHAAGNSLDLRYLQHVFANAAPSVASLLLALTHLTARLHLSDETVSPLRTLIDAALALNIPAALTNASSAKSKPDGQVQHITTGVDEQPDLLSTYASFAVNLLSVDATYLEPLLNTFVTTIFLFPIEQQPEFEPLVKQVINAAILTHPRASYLLADIISRRYPHPVRPTAEHVSFSRSILFIARVVPNRSLLRAVVNSLFERLSAIEATVPSDVRDVKVIKTESSGLQSVSFEDSDTNLLCPDASKLQAIMLELVRHLDLLHEHLPAPMQHTHLEVLFSAYDTYVIPVHRTRFTPYVLMYASSLVGRTYVHDMMERMRQLFFDATQGDRLRAYVLEHSAVFVCRARLVSTKEALLWFSRISSWLNAYVDAIQASNSPVLVDVDVHALFYAACATLLSTLTRCPHILKRPSAAETIARMRIARIIHSPLAPTLILPPNLVSDFLAGVSHLDGASGLNIPRVQERSFAPTCTRFGAPNRLVFSFRCPDLSLPLLREKVDRFIRWDDSLSEKTKTSGLYSAQPRSTLELTDPMDISITT